MLCNRFRNVGKIIIDLSMFFLLHEKFKVVVDLIDYDLVTRCATIGFLTRKEPGICTNKHVHLNGSVLLAHKGIFS